MPPKRPHGVTSKKTLFFNTDGRTSNLTVVRRVRAQWCGTGVRGPRRTGDEGSERESCVSHLYVHGYCMTRAGRRQVGAPGRLIIWCPWQTNNLAPLNRHFSKFFGLGQGWRVYLKIRALFTDNFWRSPFACGQSDCTSTTFPITPVKS
jgi:hypothetical protein